MELLILGGTSFVGRHMVEVALSRGHGLTLFNRGLNQGLTFRPLGETARDTLAWDRTRPDLPRKAGISREREASLLDRWHRRHG
ncbi:hypothetical protein C8P63_11618 [Melghirimyces profundicolus]|uniref:NAD-dependent epimerase/dehydratase family protein n=1 Tax=Melghirimyces profundicolus TaxID=1242148 RepID=A0A2T6BQR4_9BACL|nr:hypothetical protein [Melghirimyces profundicolus]PTX58431.1 hypothetical protein C8P63_11618 [Melghirimyces profundicolus]